MCQRYGHIANEYLNKRKNKSFMGRRKKKILYTASIDSNEDTNEFSDNDIVGEMIKYISFMTSHTFSHSKISLILCSK